MVQKLARLIAISVVFSIPMNIYGQQVPSMPHAWIGFSYTWHNFGTSSPIHQWLYVQRVEPDSPAMRAGLRVQDAVLSIDGRAVNFRSASAALAYFAAIQSGSSLRLVVLRQDKRIPVSIRPAPIPPERMEEWRRNLEVAKRADIKKTPRH